MRLAITVMVAVMLWIAAKPSQWVEVTGAMTNQDYRKQAESLVNQFHTDLDPHLLTQAYQALENVLLLDQPDRDAWPRIRSETLQLWLMLIETVDQHIDPGFDVEDEPEALVQPPSTPDGILYPPGADPARITDPEARAKYESDIKANNQKISTYGFQTKMHRLEERIVPRARKFILDFYAPNHSDRAEFSAMVDKIVTTPERKDSLLELIPRP